MRNPPEEQLLRTKQQRDAWPSVRCSYTVYLGPHRRRQCGNQTYHETGLCGTHQR